VLFRSGRAGTSLLPLLKDGAKGIREYQEEARQLGLTISTKTAKDAARFTDVMNRLHRILRITPIVIGSVLAPAMELVANRAIQIVIATNKWIANNRQLVLTVAKVALVAGAAGIGLVLLGVATSVASSALIGFAASALIAKAAAGLLLSPLGLVSVALAAGTAAFLVYSGTGAIALDYLGNRFSSLLGVTKKTFGGIRDALAAGDLKLAAEVLWAGIKVVWHGGIADIQSAFNISMSGMKALFTSVLSTMSKLWATFSLGVRSVWEVTQNAIAKGFTEILGAFDKSIDVDAAKKQLDEQSRQNLDSLASETIRKLKEIDAGKDEKLKKIIADLIKQQSKALDELEDARKNLDETIKDAGNARKNAEEDGSKFDFNDRTQEFIRKFDAIGASIVNKIDVRGSFDVFASRGVPGLGDGYSKRSLDAAERTAAASERTEKGIAKIARVAQSGGMRFT